MPEKDENNLSKHEDLKKSCKNILEDNGFKVKTEVQIPLNVPYGQQRKFIGNKISGDYPESGKEKLNFSYFEKYKGYDVEETRVDVCGWKRGKNIVGVEISVGGSLKKDIRDLRKINFQNKIILTEDINGEIEGRYSGILEGGDPRKIKIVDLEKFRSYIESLV